MQLTLIQRDVCHLCDQAWEQLVAAARANGIDARVGDGQ